MPSPIILNFYDYHEAHLVAHQFQLEGQTAEVFENGYTTFPLAGSIGFRLLVFEPSEMDEDAGELEVGIIGNAIDTVLRMVALAGSCMIPVCLFFSMLAGTWSIELGSLIYLAAQVFILWLIGAVITVTAYDDFRNGRAFGTILILGVGWCICISYLLGLGSALISVVRLLTSL